MKLRLEPQPFLGLIPASRQTKGRIRKVCPICGQVDWPYPSELTKKNRKVEVDWKKREARGLCGRCHRRTLLKSERRLRALYDPHFTPKARRLILSAAKAGEGWAKRDLRRAFGPSPLPGKTVIHQARAARAPRPKRSMKLLLKGSRERPLELCSLCGLLVERSKYRRSWVKGAWHPPCLAAWLNFSGQRRAQFSTGTKPFLPPRPAPKMGRPFSAEHTARNLIAFLRHRADVLGFPGGCSISASAARHKTTRQNLHDQVTRLVGRLPGDWRLVFQDLKAGACRSMQRLFEFPDQLGDLVNAGERDHLVRWLSDHGMPPDQISRVTAVPPERIFKLLGKRLTV